MSDIQQVIRIKQIADVGEVLKGIEDIQKNLNKLALGPETKASFDRFFANIDKQIEKANKAKDSGFKNKKDVDDYTRAMDQIITNYTRIIEKIDVLKAKGTPLEGKAEEFRQAGEQIKNLGRELNKLKASFADIQKETAMGAKVATSDQKFQPKEWEKIRQNFTATKVDIDEVNKALTALNKKYQEATTRGWTEGNNAEEWAKFKAGIDGVQFNLNRYTKSLDEQDQKQQQLNGAQATFNTLLNEGKVALDAAGNAAKTDAENITKVAKETGQAARESQQLNSELEHFKSKAAYFFGIANGINLLKRAIRSAYSTVKDLDAVMTETAVVTNFDVGDMWSQLPMYTQRANELGVSIHSAYEAATIFYQQGLKTNEVMAVSTETLKMARIAGLDAATASDRMTNALRGFNMEMDKVSAQRVNDVYSKLAAITASNTDEISTAMTKVASLAHNANMEFETTAAFLAQIIESTRESAETAGTALKTVVARFSEVKKLYSKGELLGEDEEGEEIDVNRVSTALKSAGINLNEYLTGAKGLDDIFIELAEKWDSLDIVQQRYIATMAAGSRQQSRFIALMSDYGRTMQLVEAANTANGASQEQYSKTLESLQTKLERLKNAWNEFVLGLSNSDFIKGAVDVLTDLLTVINKLISKTSKGNPFAKMVISFFTAFSAFKIGQKLIGKSGTITRLFGGLVGNSEIVARGSATQIAKTFYATLADRIVGWKGKLGNINPASAKGALSNLGNSFIGYFSPNLDSTFLKDTSGIQEHLLDNLDATKPGFDSLWQTIEKGNLTVGELNDALEKNGQSYRITSANAAEYGMATSKLTTSMKVASAAGLALGTALTIIGSKMEQDKDLEEWGKLIKGVGTALIFVGTIMSVLIPLQAQLMAKGVSSAIYSIPIIGWIAAIISAVIALGVAIANFAKGNSAEAKAAKMAEGAKAAAEAANDAKEAYEKLNEAFENLADKYDVIEQATEGTREWRDAVRETNSAVLELANTYDNLSITRDENGILRIENEQDIKDRALKDTLQTEGYSTAAQIDAIEARQEALIKDIQKKVLDKETVDYFTSGEGLNKLTRGMDETAIRELIREKYDYEIDEDEATALKKFGQEYGKSGANLTSQRTIMGATMLENANIDKDLQKYVNTAITDRYVEKTLDESKSKFTGYSKSVLREAYARVQGKGSWKELVAEDSSVKDMTKAQLQEYLATKTALEQTNTQLNIFANNISNLSDAEKALFEKQEGGALTKEQLEELKNAENPEEIYEKFGGNDVYGENGLEDFRKWYYEALSIADKNFDVAKYYGQSFATNLDKDYTKNLSSEEYKTFADNLWSIYTTSGQEGVTTLSESISELTKGMSDDEVKSFINSINGVNWASADSIKTLNTLADDFNISEDAIRDFENQIIELNNAVAQVDFEELTKMLGLAKNIISGEQGRDFTEEQKELAIKGGAKESDFHYNALTEKWDYVGVNLQDVATNIQNGMQQNADQLASKYRGAEVVGDVLKERGPLNSTDYQNKEEIQKFLMAYIAKAGKDSLISDQAINNASTAELQKIYDSIIRDYNERSDIKKDAEEAASLVPQFNTGTQNAAAAINGDEDAKQALLGQIASSELSEEIKQQLISGIQQGYEIAIKNAGAITDIFTEANQYGIEADDLNEYIESLRQVDELENANIATLYSLALANAKYQEGFKSVIDSYDEWVELKKEDGSIRPDEGNEVQSKAYSQLKKDLKEMFNLTEDISDEFLQSADNVELLEKAVNGDMDAVSKLRGELAKTNIADSIADKDDISKAIDAVVADMPNFEFGMSMDDSEAMKALDALLQASGMTADQIQAIYDSLGWAPELSYEEMDVESASKLSNTGWQEIVTNPLTGETKKVRTDGLTEYANNGKVLVPVIGNQRFVKPSMPSAAAESKSSGGGGGGGSSKKPSYWENPYDELYNLQEKINEALRTRETLERRYQKLLKQEQATLSDIRKSYYAQISNLRTEADLQKQFAAGRLRQISEVGNKIYTDSEGNRKSFNSLGVTKYASYNAQTGLIQIDWNGLDAISKDSSREEEGKAAEAYISKLEELVSSYEEVRDKLWDIEDKIEDLRDAAIESYLSFEDRVMEAIVNSYQQQIDSYQSMSDAIDKANTEVIDSLQKQIDLSRQIRDNTEKEKDISDKENRLAYLQRDTSGANDLEIQKLEKELKDAREGYTDDLIDQAIQNMQDDADTAAEQRARQIETMTEQLEIMKDTGALWQNVYELMNAAAEGDGALSPHSSLVKLLQETEAFASLSNIGQAKWWGEVAEEFHKAWIGLSEAEDKYKKDANNDGTIYDSGTQNAIEEVQQAPATQPAPTPAPTATQSGYDEKTKYGVALAVCDGYWGNGETRKRNLESKGFNYSEIQGIVNKVIKDANSGAWYGKYYGIKDTSQYKMSKFKTGGLADFTGPAWLDGTKSKPELILNAQDSANFIALKDILASLLSVQGGRGIVGNGGDNYFDIDISASLGSDYDVDQLKEKIKRDIYNDGQYRNVNTINYLR